jgi:ATP-binding cassette subfamily C protein EexD
MKQSMLISALGVGVTSTPPELQAVASASRSAIFAAALFSLFLNLLMLVPSLYMLQVYDRVLSTGSIPTLLVLTLITVFLFMVYGGLEWVRSQIMIVASIRFDAMLGPAVHDAIFTRTMVSAGQHASAQPLDDIDRVRQFVTGSGLFALLDAPWVPLYVGLMFLFHWWIGVAAVVSIVVLAGLTLWTELATQHLLKKAGSASQAANQQTTAHLRHAEAITAMGMLPRLRQRWQHDRGHALDAQHRASARAGLIAAISKTYRLTSQSLILGLGAYLAIQREISPGMVIAGSILLGRALAPIDQLIGSWRSLDTARSAYERLRDLLGAHQPPPERMTLPDIRGEYQLDKVTVAPDSARPPVIKSLSLHIPAGTQVGIIGPSAAGKSTLVRALLGLYSPSEGALRLDGAELIQYERGVLGDAMGYLPQDVELLEGTMAENIARFGEVDAESVVKAAQLAGVHDMILALPEGYETRLDGRRTLSAGQRQRVALARAVYRDPKVVILDEPNSNLDEAGNAALERTLAALRSTQATVIIVTHRSRVLAQLDAVLLLIDGKLSCYGTPEQVAAELKHRAVGLAPGATDVRGRRAVA